MACPAGFSVDSIEARVLAGGDQQLRPHQVDAQHGLGDRMLHLQPGIHLQEEELGGVSAVAGLSRNSTVPAPW